MHGAAVGRRLGAQGVLVPRLAGVFCALGMLNADVGQDFARVFIARLDDDTVNEARDVYADLEGDARAWLREGGFKTDAMRFEHEADLRYAGQQWDVRVADAEADVAELRAAFEREHDRLFGHVQPDSTVELTKLRVVGIGTLPALVPAPAEPGGPAPAPASTREVYAFGPRGEPSGLRVHSGIPRRRPPARPPARRPAAGGGADHDGGGGSAGPAGGSGVGGSAHSLR